MPLADGILNEVVDAALIPGIGSFIRRDGSVDSIEVESTVRRPDSKQFSQP
ncbi:MAG: hypothetical protein KGK16_11445 [Bradyrhizobium sp.]|nr:hypothetical protein [Bradyrhizobium sp.]